MSAALQPCSEAPTADVQVLDALSGPADELESLKAHLLALQRELEQLAEGMRIQTSDPNVWPNEKAYCDGKARVAKSVAAQLGRLLAPAGETKE